MSCEIACEMTWISGVSDSAMKGSATPAMPSPDPIEDYGLVSDCNVLLSALDDLTGDASLNWSTELPLDQWEGVEIDDSLNRVTALNLSAKGLDGNVPPELANLTHLKVLSLSANELTGTIPSELVKLSQLEVLSLDEQ